MGDGSQHIFRWDLDKTYLETQFDQLGDLLRSAFEGAEAKRSVPGASAILRELRRGEGRRVCFISGSPKQMRRVLTKKLAIDGVEFDEFILKPNLRNLLRGRFRALRDQVGYKLPALLRGRLGIDATTRETCFGDDAEADAFVYSLYADLLAKKVDQALLAEILARSGCYRDTVKRTLALAQQVERVPAVQRIFIRLERSSTERFERYRPRLVPIYNYFQAALVLLEDALLDSAAVVRIALEMAEQSGFSVADFVSALEDLLARGCLTRETARDFALHLDSEGIPLGGLPTGSQIVQAFGARVRALRTPEPTPGPRPAIDYLSALAADLDRS